MNLRSEVATLEIDAKPDASGLECLVIVARQHGLHLSASQLIHDKVLTGGEVSIADLIKCATKAGLSAELVNLGWNGLRHLKKALPAIVKLTKAPAASLAGLLPNELGC